MRGRRPAGQAQRRQERPAGGRSAERLRWRVSWARILRPAAIWWQNLTRIHLFSSLRFVQYKRRAMAISDDNKEPLTDRQRQALDFIGRYISSQGYPPTL